VYPPQIYFLNCLSLSVSILRIRVFFSLYQTRNLSRGMDETVCPTNIQFVSLQCHCMHTLQSPHSLHDLLFPVIRRSFEYWYRVIYYPPPRATFWIKNRLNLF